MENYTIEDQIASGKTARVFKAVCKKDNHYVAIKCVRDLKNKRLNELMRNEVEILRLCQSINIIKMIDFFEREGLLYIVLEYCNGGNLQEYVKGQKDGRLTEKDSLRILEQIIEGFKVLSENNCLHRDFKAENILLHNGIAKIADFGGSVMMAQVQELHKSYFGSKDIFSPERMRCSLYGNKADVYSLGAVFCFMLTGSYPNSAQSKEVKEVGKKPLSELSKMFLQRTLEADKTKRISWDEIFQMNLNPLKTMIFSRLPTGYGKMVHTNVQKLQKRSSIPQALKPQSKAAEPPLKKTMSEVCKQNKQSGVHPSKMSVYRQLDDFERFRGFYMQEVENHLFKLQFVNKAMSRVARQFQQVYFNEDNALILRCVLSRLEKLLGWVQTRQNIFQLPAQIFKRFNSHDIYNELVSYVKTVVADVQPLYDAISQPLIAYIRENKLNLEFASELEKPEMNKEKFFNYMMDFCFRLDSLLGYTKTYDSKVRIMLLRFVVLQLVAARPMRRPELTRKLDQLGSASLQQLQKQLSAKFEQVTTNH